MHGGGVGPYWTPISPSAGSFFHADTHKAGDERGNQELLRLNCPASLLHNQRTHNTNRYG